jgi:DNA-binding protein
MSKKNFLSLNAMDKIMRDSGAERVSDDAKEALADSLQEEGKRISEEANKLAKHAGRKTITSKDILLAIKK